MGDAQGTVSTAETSGWARIVTNIGAPWVLNAVVPVVFGAVRGDLWWSLFVSVMAGILPILMIVAMMARRSVGDVHVTNRDERTAVLGGIIALAVAALVIELVAAAPTWIVAMTVAGVATIGLIGAITVIARWKISVHTAVAGAWIVLGVGFISPWALLAVPLAVLIGWSRLVLRDHTLNQALAGFALGAGVSWLALLLA
ncbi:phosphatase PAP2 family protein (plasmid) [Tomitella fengzijianii]|uniref:Phosphatase PAP2 family protein n=1 Tax=Tomitella fengzijianii TaxID=2597660 RepID=A0A516X8Y8_9ACTN|nr:phosphatase PAP2 family protein [Tomitella fengzijianii]QDQ99535.1 phosphatase PAP2 family protein [Tomitella fengzijianii]